MNKPDDGEAPNAAVASPASSLSSEEDAGGGHDLHGIPPTPRSHDWAGADATAVTPPRSNSSKRGKGRSGSLSGVVPSLRALYLTAEDVSFTAVDGDYNTDALSSGARAGAEAGSPRKGPSFNPESAVLSAARRPSSLSRPLRPCLRRSANAGRVNALAAEDDERSREELLELVADLRRSLSAAKKDRAEEKTKRKKKENLLLMVAGELKGRGEKIADQASSIERVSAAAAVRGVARWAGNQESRCRGGGG